MRIIAGKHKGRRIELAKNIGDVVRPTSDFAREAIFNILVHSKVGLAGGLEGKRVLDLFCGTGAFGLEALSRGAAEVTFIDANRDAIANARNNAQRMNEVDTVDFQLADGSKLGRARKQYDLIFLDPPYFGKLVEPSLNCLHKGEWIAQDALVIVEHDAKEIITIPESFTVIDERRYGRAVIKLLKVD